MGAGATALAATITAAELAATPPASASRSGSEKASITDEPKHEPISNISNIESTKDAKRTPARKSWWAAAVLVVVAALIAFTKEAAARRFKALQCKP